MDPLFPHSRCASRHQFETGQFFQLQETKKMPGVVANPQAMTEEEIRSLFESTPNFIDFSSPSPTAGLDLHALAPSVCLDPKTSTVLFVLIVDHSSSRVLTRSGRSYAGRRIG